MTDQVFELITKKARGIISSDELKILNRWINDSKDNQVQYKSVFKQIVLSTDFIVYLINEDAAWQKIDKATKENFIDTFDLRKVLKYAAIIALPILVASLLYYFVNESRFLNERKTIALLEKIKPGADKAILTLSDGTELELGENKKKTVLIDNTQLQVIDSNNIIVYKNKRVADVSVKDRVYVPKGGKYKVTLSDGTKVWLNSDSYFDFPVQFNEKKRVVKLKGEAYFEVAKDSLKPFIVETKGVSVEVLGTAFNISAYEDDTFISTSLVEGKVKVKSFNDEVVLQPGFQSVFSENKLSVKKINLELATSWKQGMFRFENTRLQDITKKLQRWYNVEFFYDDHALKNIRFYGAVKKENNLSVILSTLKETNHFSYSVNDNIILIKRANK